MRTFPVGPKKGKEQTINNSEVVTKYDPGLFTWHEKPRVVTKNTAFITINPHGQIRILGKAGQKFKAEAKECPEGGYKAIIGKTPKAIAIKPQDPDKEGFIARKLGNSQSALGISCKQLIQDVFPSKEPIKIPAVWDDEAMMLVGILP